MRSFSSERGTKRRRARRGRKRTLLFARQHPSPSTSWYTVSERPFTSGSSRFTTSSEATACTSTVDAEEREASDLEMNMGGERADREWDERSRRRDNASTDSASNSLYLDAKAPSRGREVVLAFGAREQ